MLAGGQQRCVAGAGGLLLVAIASACGLGSSELPDARKAEGFDTVLDEAPPAATASNRATFAFRATEPATFSCVVDGAATACTSPLELAVGPGPHTFSVTATRLDGLEDPTPAEATWIVDQEPPDTTLLLGPAALGNDPVAYFEFGTTEPGVTYECSLDGGPFVPCTSPWQVEVGAGSHTLTVRAIDAAGNVDPSPLVLTWSVDLTTPDTAIDGGPSGTVGPDSASLSFSTPNGGADATFECAIDGGAFAACTSPHVLVALATGPHAFAVRARTAAGTVDPTPATRDFAVDATPPALSLETTPPALSYVATDTFAFVADEPATFECQLDGVVDFVACSSPWTTPTTPDGDHTFQLRATDAYGNVATTTYAWRVEVAVCGDGVRTGPEACDDGNLVGDDACTPLCQLACGDGTPNAIEECDDGNTTSGDGCSASCRYDCPDIPAGNSCEGGTCCGGNAAAFAAGQGLPAAPYRIDTVCQLRLVAHYDQCAFELGGDLDLTGDFFEGLPRLRGSLDGKLHRISNWVPSTTPFTSNAFIDEISTGATVENLVLDGVHLEHAYGAGVLAQYNFGTLRQVAVLGRIDAGTSIAGLASNNYGLIERSLTRVDFGPAVNWYGSGFVQENYGTIRDCYADGDVTASYAAGFLRWNFSTVERVYAAGHLTSYAAPARGLVFDGVGAPVSSGYWDTGTSGTALSAGGTGLDSLAFGRAASFPGWDFANVWSLDASDQPYLRWYPDPVDRALCGDDDLDPGEACDDGNLTSGDGCAGNCRSLRCADGAVDPEEVCDDGNLADGDGCSADCRSDETCSNGIVDVAADEACDDGNTSDGDGCSATCTSDETCGNDIVDAAAGEACDDGNTTSGDGCKDTCDSNETCGNGVTDAVRGEVCDDGNTTSGDGCAGNCLSLTCGDGLVDAGEACDDGGFVDGDDCAADCRSDETCGNGVRDLVRGEICDDGNTAGGDGCSADCISDESCANGIVDVDAGETCDDYNTFPQDGCGPTCRLECGDDAIVGWEVCDDGNAVGGDGCSADCYSNERCGNGYYDPLAGEICDDGNLVGGDGCSADCRSREMCGDLRIDPAAGEVCDDGNTSSGDGCAGNCRSFTCADSVVDAGEVCDDGNLVGGDGCGFDCRSDETCGNGFVDPGEFCDDGGRVAGDGCSPACASECGDGTLSAVEACDDGNATSGDGCSASCALETCGGAAAPALFAGGTGYPGAPYRVATAAQLVSFRSYPACAFRLVADIDLANTHFPPIPDFSGTLDGGYRRISGWRNEVGSDFTTYAFIVNLHAGATLRNLRFEDASQTYAGPFGGSLLVAFNRGGTISRVAVTGTFAAGSSAGGIVGYQLSGSIEQSFAHLHLDAASTLGGVVGINKPGGVIRDSYAIGDLSGSAAVAGVVGANEGELSRGYAVTTLHAWSDTPAGVAASNTGVATATYWDTQVSGTTTSATGTGLPSAAMASAASFPGWDFATVWTVGGWSRPQLRWYDEVLGATCGDGTRQLGEVCDDGNLASGDGCAADCQSTNCGDGVVHYNEVCDDANQRSGDGCTADCQAIEVCGNSVVDVAAGERCDDGNLVGNDGCSAACLVECGDGTVTGAEQCDDGNTLAGDGCTPTCRLEGCEDAQASFAGGLGTGADPYRIATVAQLDRVRDAPSCAYRLVADLDLTGVPFLPIPALTGSLDGGYHEVTGWQHDQVGDYLGFVAHLTGTLENLRLTNATLTSAGSSGLAVGSLDGGTIRRVSTTGLISGPLIVGGLVGWAVGGSIEACRSDATVISADIAAGGLVAYQNLTTLASSYAEGPVTGTDFVGGLVGFDDGATILDAFAAGPVTATTGVAQGLTGYDDGSAADAYWDVDNTGASTSVSGAPLSAADFTQEASFPTWDFATTWTLADGIRPELRWYAEVLAAVCGDGVVALSEACDDGNTVGGDGCAADCGSTGS